MTNTKIIEGIDAILAGETLWSSGRRILKRIKSELLNRFSTWTPQEYKCTECGLEIVILKRQKLPKAECQDCGTMTMRPK